MKKILTGLFLLINITCFSQSVKKLEHELSFTVSGDEKDIAYKLLKIDCSNERAINYLVDAYARKNQKDSISILFDKLVRENPQSPKPYLIRAEELNAKRAGLTYTQQINYLKEAYKLDSVNEETIYSLGRLYYDLFVKEFKTDKRKANLDDYSSNSILYFSKLCNQIEKYNETLKYPFIQLANYSGNLNLKQRYENYTIQHHYFPVSAFVDLPNDWKTNYAVNVIKCVYEKELFFKVTGIEPALMHLNWYDKHLKALNEPVFSDSLPGKVFRFTWLRSFHNPIVIGLKCNNNSISVYWKVCDGRGGYDPGKIIKNKKKTLTIGEWNDFVASIESIDFWNLPATDSRTLGTDGAQWILEGKELGKYHVVDRWSGVTIEKVCLKLLALTGLKIKESDIY